MQTIYFHIGTSFFPITYSNICDFLYSSIVSICFFFSAIAKSISSLVHFIHSRLNEKQLLIA